MITSTGNARIRELVRMKKSAKERSAKDAFIVEGPKMFREIPKDLLMEVYVSESYPDKSVIAGGKDDLKSDRRKGAAGEARPDTCRTTSAAGGRDRTAYGTAVEGQTAENSRTKNAADRRDGGSGCGKNTVGEVVSDSVFQYLSDTKNPQGILAVVKQLHYELDDLFGENPLIVVLENVQDPGNLGTILRTAEAAGVTGILMSAGCADIYNPKVTRSTMGSIFRVPFVYTQDLADALTKLQKRGIRLFAAHLQGSEELYSEVYTGPSAFLVGNESRGLTAETASLADKAVRIPMSGDVESLNAAIASSIMMFEAKRQRLIQRLI